MATCWAAVMGLGFRVKEVIVKLTAYELRTKIRLGRPLGDHIGFWGGPAKGYTTNLVHGSYGYDRFSLF